MYSTLILQAAGWTILHSLWIGALLYVVYTLAMKIGRKQSPSLLYALSMGTMLFFFAICVSVFIYYSIPATGDQVRAIHSPSDLWLTGQIDSRPEWTAMITSQIPNIALLYILGVALLSLRSIYAMLQLQRLRSQSTTLSSDYWDEKIKYIAHQLNLTRTVIVRCSNQLWTPVLHGAIKPLILIPIMVINRLDEAELDMLIAHEMAHLKRYDHIFLVIQRFIENLLYYHPFIWHLSRRIDRHREEACDDLVTHHMGAPHIYAEALYRLAHMKYESHYTQLALHATGQSSYLLNRIKRILNMKNQSNKQSNRWSLLLLVPLTIMVFVFQSTRIQSEALSSNDGYSEADRLNSMDTIPEYRNESVQRIMRNENGQTVEMEIRNGALTQFKVNGEEVDPNDPQYEQLAKDLQRSNVVPPPPPPPAPHAPAAPLAPPPAPAPPATGWDSMDDLERSVEDWISNIEITMNNEMNWDSMGLGQHFHQFFNDTMNWNGPIFKSFDWMFDGDGMGSLHFQLDSNTIHSFENSMRNFSFDQDRMKHHMDQLRQQMDRLKGLQYDSRGSIIIDQDGQRKEFHWGDDNQDDIVIREFKDGERHVPNHWREKNSGNLTLQQRIQRELQHDGFIAKDGSYSFQLKYDRLKINGEKQPREVFEKYLDIYRGFTGSYPAKGEDLKMKVDGI